MDVVSLVWVVALSILVVVGIVWMIDLQRRLRWMQRSREEMFAGEGEGADLGAVIESLAARLTEMNARTDRLVARTEQIDATLTHAVQGMGLVRFRAFQDTGGDQSFALALADGEGNGVVISGLYGRGGKTRIYAKPIQGWLSTKPLGEEEEQALAKARQSVLGNA